MSDYQSGAESDDVVKELLSTRPRSKSASARDARAAERARKKVESDNPAIGGEEKKRSGEGGARSWIKAEAVVTSVAQVPVLRANDPNSLAQVLGQLGTLLGLAAEVAPHERKLACVRILQDLDNRLFSDGSVKHWWALQRARYEGKETLSGIAEAAHKQFVAGAQEKWRKQFDNFRTGEGEEPRQAGLRLLHLARLAGVDDDEEQLVRRFTRASELGDVALGAKSLEEAIETVHRRWEWMQERKEVSSRVAKVNVIKANGGTVCYQCGKEGHVRASCPETRCFKCGGRGHMARACTVSEKKEGAGEKKENKPTAYPVSRVGVRRWVETRLGGRQVNALVDSGATTSCVRPDVIAQIDWTAVSSDITSVRTFGQGEKSVVATAEAKLQVGRPAARRVRLAVVDGMEEELVLGADVLEPLGVMGALEDALRARGAKLLAAEDVAQVVEAAAARRGEETSKKEEKAAADEDIWEPEKAFDALPRPEGVTEEQWAKLVALLKKHRRLFVRDGCLPPAAKVEPVVVRVEGKPVIEAVRPWNPWKREEMRKHEEKMVKAGVARYVQTSSWRAEPHLVAKEDGSSRHVVDYRGANLRVIDDAYPMPHLKEELHRLAGSKVYSRLDFHSGFLQIPVAKECWETLTFRGTRGLMVMTRLSMGLKTAPAIFNRLVRQYVVEKLDEGLRQRTAQYVDDLGHGDQGVDEEWRWLAATFGRLEDAGMSLKLKKCLFLEPEMPFLGYAIGKGGEYRPREERVAALLEMGDPETRSDLRSLLGMAERYRPWIWRYDLLTRELYGMLAKRTKYELTNQVRFLVDRLKIAIAEATMLKLPEHDKSYEATVDAGAWGTGIVIEQGGRPVEFASRAFKGSELNYSTFDRELEGLRLLAQKGQYYSVGRPERTTAWVDHQPLDHFEDMVIEDDPTGRRRRAQEEVRLANLAVRYRPRKEQVVADALSKSPAFRKLAEEERKAMKEMEKEREKREKEKEEEKEKRKEKAEEQRDEALAEAKERAKEKEEKEKEREKGKEKEREKGTSEARVEELVAIVAGKATSEEWREKQQRDPRLRRLTEYLASGKLPAGTAEEKANVVAEATQMTVVDGVLYHLSRPGKNSAAVPFTKRVVIPEDERLRKKLFEKYHVKEGVHVGARRTFARMQEYVWWRTMQADVEEAVKKCYRCNEYKKVDAQKMGLLEPTTTASLGGNSVVAVDLGGPYPETPEGYKYAIFIIYYDDDWPDIVPIKEASTEEVVKVLDRHVVADYGAPNIIITDRGSNLISEAAQTFYDKNGIKKNTTTAGNPQADGKAEALVKRGKDAMRKAAADLGASWAAEGISETLKALRSTASTGDDVSPFEKRFSRKMRLPSTFALPQAEEGLDDEEKKEMKEKRDRLRDEGAARMKEQYDKGRKESDLQVGDKVWLRNTEKANSLDPERIGPFEVAAKKGKLTVKVKEVDGGPRLGRRHPIINVKNVARFDSEMAKPVEVEVERIEDHKGKARNRLYKVVWKDGDVTWEPLRNLVDRDGGEVVVAAALETYWRAHPRLKSGLARS